VKRHIVQSDYGIVHSQMPALSAVLIGRVSHVGFSQPALQWWTTFLRHALDGLKFETPETAGRDLNCHRSNLPGGTIQQAPISVVEASRRVQRSGQSAALGCGTASIVTRSGIGGTRVTLSERGTKDNKAENTGSGTMRVNPCLSLIRRHTTGPAALELRDDQFPSDIDRSSRPSAGDGQMTWPPHPRR
jgi:hypothetical protein